MSMHGWIRLEFTLLIHLTAQAFQVKFNERIHNMNPQEFKTAVVRGLLSHEVVVGDTDPLLDEVSHDLKEYAPGSRGDGSTRRKLGRCRACPNTTPGRGRNRETQRRTSYYCPKCNVCFHPACFVTWHKNHGHNYAPPA